MQLFYDDVLENTRALYERLYSNLTEYLRRASENVIVQVPYEEIVKDCGEEIKDRFKDSYAQPMYGVRLKLLHEPSRAHSGWLAFAASRAIKRANESLDRQTTMVGILQQGRYERLQTFSTLEEESYFCSMGSNAKECLEALLKSEGSFNPDWFDTDGYAKLPLQDLSC